MREIILVSVGESGIKSSNTFWQTMCFNNNLTLEGQVSESTDLSNLNTFFNESSNGKFDPRAILISSDSKPTNQILSGLVPPQVASHQSNSQFRNFYKSESMISGGEQAVDFQSARSIAYKSMPRIKTQVRRELEACDSFGGFMFVNDLGEEAGSGMGSLVLETLRDFDDKSGIIGHSIFPDQRNSQNLSNAVFSLGTLSENLDVSLLYSHKKLQSICSKNPLAIPSGVVGHIISHLSIPFAFPVTKTLSFSDFIAQYSVRNLPFAVISKPELCNSKAQSLPCIEESISNMIELNQTTPQVKLQEGTFFKPIFSVCNSTASSTLTSLTKELMSHFSVEPDVVGFQGLWRGYKAFSSLEEVSCISFNTAIGNWFRETLGDVNREDYQNILQCYDEITLN